MQFDLVGPRRREDAVVGAGRYWCVRGVHDREGKGNEEKLVHGDAAALRTEGDQAVPLRDEDLVLVLFLAVAPLVIVKPGRGRAVVNGQARPFVLIGDRDELNVEEYGFHLGHLALLRAEGRVGKIGEAMNLAGDGFAACLAGWAVRAVHGEREKWPIQNGNQRVPFGLGETALRARSAFLSAYSSFSVRNPTRSSRRTLMKVFKAFTNARVCAGVAVFLVDMVQQGNGG